jgi:hypothetical protein
MRSLRRPCNTRPHLEALEDRQLLNGGSISGYVYHDANNDGLREAGESPIAGSSVELRNASGTTIATASTDATGRYEFTQDSTISTAPATRTVLATFDSSKTGWTRSMEIAQFDPSLGTLTQVEIVNSATFESQMSFESLDGESSTIAATVNGTATLSGPGFTGLTASLSLSDSYDAAPEDGEIDFAGPAGHESGPISATGSESLSLTAPADLSSYIGTGTVTVTERVRASSSVSGPGNVLALLNTSAQAEVSVIYHYNPSDALQPGDYLIVQSPQPAGYIDGLDSRDGTVLPGSAVTDVIPIAYSGSSLTDNNFGELLPASLSGHVYIDANDNGLRDTGEVPLAGVVVNLLGTTDPGLLAATSVSTDASGTYRFDNLRPGDYTIRETQPPGFRDGQDSIGTLGGTEADDAFFVAVAQGDVGEDYDFGELPALSAVTPPVVGPSRLVSKVQILATSLRYRR